VDPFGLVIFDCDGVLVDSERLAVRVETEILASLGWSLSEAEVVDRFVGRSAAYMHQEVERHLGRGIDWEEVFERRYEEVFSRELVPVPGVVEALGRLSMPTCVGSSGTHEKLRFSLGVTGLRDRFAGRIFSTSDVPNGKPAPDLFLYAAEQMGVAPAACAVVEDSPVGVEAGIAAGMAVFAYCGGVNSRSRLARGGVVTFAEMHQLPALLTSERAVPPAG